MSKALDTARDELQIKIALALAFLVAEPKDDPLMVGLLAAAVALKDARTAEGCTCNRTYDPEDMCEWCAANRCGNCGDFRDGHPNRVCKTWGGVEVPE